MLAEHNVYDRCFALQAEIRLNRRRTESETEFSAKLTELQKETMKPESVKTLDLHQKFINPLLEYLNQPNVNFKEKASIINDCRKASSSYDETRKNSTVFLKEYIKYSEVLQSFLHRLILQRSIKELRLKQSSKIYRFIFEQNN